MIWLTWRQHRRQLLVTTVAMAALAAVLLPTGLSMRHAVTRLGLGACAGSTPAAGCGARIDEFVNTYELMALVSVLLLVIPPLVGVFWGAPLIAREVEQGTHRLVHQADGTVVTSGLLRCPPPGRRTTLYRGEGAGAAAGRLQLRAAPPGRPVWAFQWIETGVFLVLAALLVWWTVRRLRRVA